MVRPTPNPLPYSPKTWQVALSEFLQEATRLLQVGTQRVKQLLDEEDKKNANDQ
jgi:hypothetical protein